MSEAPVIPGEKGRKAAPKLNGGGCAGLYTRAAYHLAGERRSGRDRSEPKPHSGRLRAQVDTRGAGVDLDLVAALKTTGVAGRQSQPQTCREFMAWPDDLPICPARFADEVLMTCRRAVIEDHGPDQCWPGQRTILGIGPRTDELDRLAGTPAHLCQGSENGRRRACVASVDRRRSGVVELAVGDPNTDHPVTDLLKRNRGVWAECIVEFPVFVQIPRKFKLSTLRVRRIAGVQLHVERH